MNNILWVFSVILFVGTWGEITFNLGLLGLMVGWFPALVVSYVFLSLTGRFEQCPHP